MTNSDAMDKKMYAASGMFWGLMVGVAAGLLLAPRSGRESRSQLKNKMDEAKSKAQQKMDQQRQKTADKVGQLADTAKNIADKGEDIAERGRNRTTPSL